MAKIAAIQMTSSDDVDKNLVTAKKLITEAANNAAQLIVLPEMFAVMGMDTENQQHYSEPLGHGKIQDFLSEQASHHGIWLVAGTIPILCGTTHKAYAACLIYDDSGRLMGRYDKMHLFDVVIKPGIEEYHESNMIQPGEHITVIDTPVGKIGIAICYDLRFPELFRAMLNQGVEIFIVPAAFTVKTGQAHWHPLLQARAIENICYCVGSAQVGTHPKERRTHGHSMIIDPWGKTLAMIEKDCGIIYADVDLPALHELRKKMPVQQHQRLFCHLG